MRRPGPRAAATVAGLVALACALGGVARAADPTTLECLTAYEDGLKLKNTRKLRDARAKLVVCASDSCPADVRGECLLRVREVVYALPSVVFEAKDEVGGDLIAVAVKMDGEPLVDALDGTAVPVDPGPHTFTFTTLGHAPVTKHVVILEGEKERRERVDFAPPPAPKVTAAAAPAAPSAVPALALTAPPPPAKVDDGAHRLGNKRVAALVAASVGVAGVGVGTAYGLVARSRRNTARMVCPTSTCSDPNGAALWDDAASAGDISTVAFIVGGVGLAAGITLWVLGKPAEGGAQVGVGPGSVQLTSRW